MLVVPQESGAVPTTEFDAVISNDLADLSRDASVFLITGQVPEALKSHLEIIEEPAEVVDWRRETPLLQHVQLKQIQFLDQPQRKPDVKDTDLEKLGYEILAHGPHGPLALRKSEGRRSVYYLLFTPDRSTMPYRVAFPVMLQNLVNIALSQSSAAEVRGLATGILPPLSVAPEEKYTIHGPGGTLPGEYQSDVHGELSGIMAAQVGQYDLSSKSTNKSLAVGMLNATETRLSSVGQLEFRESTVQAAGTVRTDQALWRNIAFVAFVIVLADWWFYQRRPGPILERETKN